MSLPKHTDFITTHFRYAEFMTRHVFDELIGDVDWLRLDWLLYRLCKDHLEEIRAIIEEPILVTDGLRTWERHCRLVDEGYNPSPTSDHSFGLVWNWLGVGAADVVPYRSRRWDQELFDHVIAVRTPDPDDLPWGQFIYYPERGHCHIANARRVLYSDRAVDGLPFRKYKSRTYVKE